MTKRKKIINTINEMKSWLFFEKINRTEKCLAKLTQRDKRPSSVRSEMARETTQHQWNSQNHKDITLKAIFYQIAKFERNEFLKACNISKLRQDDIIFQQQNINKIKQKPSYQSWTKTNQRKEKSPRESIRTRDPFICIHIYRNPIKILNWTL